MKRKVCLLTLKAGTAPEAAKLLEARLSESSEDFSDTAEFSAGIIEKAKQGFITFSAVPLPLFLHAKINLLKSLSVKISRNQAIVSAMETNMPENNKECDYHAAIPEKAKVILSEDGLYSAFVYYVGEGAIIFMPLDEKRLEHIFATKLSGIVAAISANKEIVETKSNADSEFREHVEAVIGSGKKIAVFSGGSSEILLSVLKKIPGSAGTFIPVEAKSDETENPDEFLSRCAKNAAESAGADLGIAISEPANEIESGESYVTVTVADSENANAARVFANPGESSKQLMIAAIVHVCSMLDDATGTAGLVNPNKKINKSSKLPLILASIGTAIGILICFAVAFAVYSSSEPKDNPLDSSVIDVFSPEETTSETESLTSASDLYGGSYIDFEDDGVFVTEEETTTAPESVITKLTTVLTTVLTTKPTTTAKPTTTLKPTTTATTTKPTTTAKPTATTTTTRPTTTTTTTTTEPVKDTSAPSGKFVFKVYGYGHGVGMSQRGAMQMANDGKTYAEILTHYYPGTSVKTDPNPPSTINYGGKDIPLIEYLCKTTKSEMGWSSAGKEAVKAQIVAIYTFAKESKFVVKKSEHAYSESFEYKNSTIYNICLELFAAENEESPLTVPYVDYNGEAAFTCYFSGSAGKTASSKSVWGAEFPYLKGGVSSPETVDATTKEFTAEELKKIILDYNDEIVLDENPAKWITVISHDSAYSNDIGYITKIRVGNREMSGNTFRFYLMDLKIRSHCFTVEYTF